MRHSFCQFPLITAILFSFVIVSGCATATKEQPPPETEPEVKPVATPPPVATPQASPVKTTTTYTVKRGDNLWDIAAQPNIYRNAFQWPLIYKGNTGTINDADLIYPGQRLTIDMQPTASAVSAAIRHANTRGPWRVGVVEESDKIYLGK